MRAGLLVHHDHVVRNLPCTRVETDEIWAFVGAKRKNAKLVGHGNIWTFTAICAESKLVMSWLVGHREADYAIPFMQDVVSRLANRIQLTTDAHRMYLTAVEAVFGWQGVDYAQLVKKYAHGAMQGYSPPVCVGRRSTTSWGGR